MLLTSKPSFMGETTIMNELKTASLCAAAIIYMDVKLTESALPTHPNMATEKLHGQ